jgi:nitronate monooxygenase
VRTAVCDLLGIDVPIVQAPMGGVALPPLAAEVSNAGGLGTLSLTWADPGTVRERVARTAERTSRPFAVNFGLHVEQEERIDAALDAGARIVSLFWGDPAAHARRVHEAGGLVLVTIGSAEEARRVEAAGADVLVAQGWEAGGHVWGTVSTLVLVPAAVDAVEVPVIAAGGIADGRGLAAVLALGAQGGWVGTRFLLAEESPIHPVYRERLLAAAETDTYYSAVFDVGWEDAPHRTLRNSTIAAWEAAGRPSPGSRPGENEPVATSTEGNGVSRYASTTPVEGVSGDIEALSLWAGQGVGLIRAVRPAAEIVRELVDEAEAVLARLAPPA